MVNMTPMRTAQAAAAGKPVTLALLDDLFGPSTERPLALRLWDGTVVGSGMSHEPSFTLVLNRPGALRRMLLPPTDLALGEAYLRDDFDVEGDLEKATELADTLAARLRSPALLARLWRKLPADEEPEKAGDGTTGYLKGRLNYRRRDAAAVRSH